MTMERWTAKKATRNINEAAQDAKAAKFFAKAAKNPALVAAYLLWRQDFQRYLARAKRAQ